MKSLKKIFKKKPNGKKNMKKYTDKEIRDLAGFKKAMELVNKNDALPLLIICKLVSDDKIEFTAKNLRIAGIEPTSNTILWEDGYIKGAKWMRDLLIDNKIS